MHETAIVRSILDIVGREMRKNGVKRLRSVKIRVGELTAVDPEALRFSFNACTKETPFEGAVLKIVEAPVRGRCSSCGSAFRIKDLSGPCPGCGSGEIERTGGTELDIISMEAV